MTSSTLSLNAVAGKAVPAQPKELDWAAHYGEVGGVDGVKFVQGKNFFNAVGKFVREAPKECWLAPLTAEQESDRRARMRKNGQVIGKRPPEAEMPKHLVDAMRENALAQAAEAGAA